MIRFTAETMYMALPTVTPIANQLKVIIGSIFGVAVAGALLYFGVIKSEWGKVIGTLVGAAVLTVFIVSSQGQEILSAISSQFWGVAP